MKKTTFLLLSVLLGTAFVSAATGWYNDFLTIKVNGVQTPNNYYLSDSDPASGAAALQGTNFGTVNSLEITGCDMKYWSDTQDRTGGAFYYLIKNADGSVLITSPVEVIWDQTAIGGNDYQGTKTTSINITNLILANGTYQLHVWAKSWGTGQGDSWLSNNSNNYVATFTVSRPVIVSGATGIADNTSFETLKAAVDALNANPDQTAGDVEIKIAGNTTEPVNFGLAVNTGTKKITIRPDADADRTITFTQAAANVGPYGHFVIGVATGNLNMALSDATVVATNNVIIDGFAVGGTTRRIKFETPSSVLTGSALFNIVGGCSNITIQNCILNNQSSGTGPICVYINQFKGTTTDASPQNILILNNIISSLDQTISGYGIRCNRSGTATTRITGLQINNNLISASGTGIEVYYCNGVSISGNEFKVKKGTTTGSGIGVWLRGSTGVMNVIGNKFTELSSVQTGTSTYATQGILTGPTSTNPFDVNIFNNMFSGMNRSISGPTALNQTYIAEIGYGTTKIYHNTFYLPVLTLPSQAGAYNAISFTTTNYKADVQNNIFISNEDAKSVLISKVITTGPVNNNVYYLRAGNTNARIVDTYSTLAAYQTANPTLDQNSRSVDVNFVDAAAGDLRITGDSEHDDHLAVPRLASVLTDMYGTSRAAYTYAGAHEGALPFYWTGAINQSKETGYNILRTLSGIEITSDKPVLVEIFTSNGFLIDKTMINGSYQHSLKNGVYIVRMDGIATKFVK